MRRLEDSKTPVYLRNVFPDFASDMRCGNTRKPSLEDLRDSLTSWLKIVFNFVTRGERSILTHPPRYYSKFFSFGWDLLLPLVLNGILLFLVWTFLIDQGTKELVIRFAEELADPIVNLVSAILILFAPSLISISSTYFRQSSEAKLASRVRKAKGSPYLSRKSSNCYLLSAPSIFKLEALIVLQSNAPRGVGQRENVFVIAPLAVDESGVLELDLSYKRLNFQGVQVTKKDWEALLVENPVSLVYRGENDIRRMVTLRKGENMSSAKTDHVTFGQSGRGDQLFY